jgi:hypothetical protein
MTKRVFAASAVVLAFFAPRIASAQAPTVAQYDSPEWLKDRRYTQGIGIREGDLELHPGVAGEFGYDSNWFLRSSSNAGYQNSGPTSPPIPALVFRVTPSLYLSTLSPQRREDSGPSEPPGVMFRAGVNLTYREFIGVSGSSAANQPQNDISQQRNVGGAADARLDISPERPLGGAIYATYARTIMPSSVSGDPNLSFNRDDVSAGGEFIMQPGRGTLDWHFGYMFRDAIFEQSVAQPYDNITHDVYTRGRWRFRPRTALTYDASIQWIDYVNQSQALQEGLVSSTPVRARLGLNGLVTDRFAILVLGGWGASFYSNTLSGQPQYDSFIGQAEAKFYLTSTPGITATPDTGLALSSIAVGYNRDFQNSYLGGYYGIDRGYARLDYFFAGRALVRVEGGAAAVEYPTMYWGSGRERHESFTDTRLDATLFGEYRFTDTFALNATLRYTGNISNNQIPTADTGTPNTNNQGLQAPQLYDMAWNRFEAFLGVRWFM